MKKGVFILSTAAAALLLAGCFHTASNQEPVPAGQATNPQVQTDASAEQTPADSAAEPSPSVSGGGAAAEPAAEKKAEEKKEEKKVEVKAEVKAQVFSFESGNLFFKPAAVTVKANQPVTFTFKNSGFHTFAIDELGVDVDLRNKTDGSVTFTPTKTGTFTFYCAIPGHKASGMSGTITVE